MLGALVVNVTTSIAFLALVAADRPWLALFAGYAPSVPYNLVVLVGVWRSAARDEGPVLWADLARVASLVLFAVLSLT